MATDGLPETNIHNGKGFTNDVKVEDFIKAGKKKKKNGEKNNIVKDLNDLLSVLGQLLQLILMILAWLFGRFNGNQYLDDATREGITSELIEWIVEGSGVEGLAIEVKTTISGLLEPLCGDNYGSYEPATGMRNPGAQLGFVGVFGILVGLACLGVEGAFGALFTAFMTGGNVGNINALFGQLSSRAGLLGEGGTLRDFLLTISSTDASIFDGMDLDMLAVDAVKLKWDERLYRENEDYNIALIRAVVPFILNVRKAKGIYTIRDITDTPIAPLVKVYDSRIHQALLDLLARSPYESDDKPGLFDETIDVLSVFDNDFFMDRYFMVRDNIYFNNLTTFKLLEDTAEPIEHINEEEFTVAEIIQLIQD